MSTADLGNIEGQHPIFSADLLCLLIALQNLQTILKPGDLSLGFDVSNLQGEEQRMAGGTGSLGSDQTVTLRKATLAHNIKF